MPQQYPFAVFETSYNYWSQDIAKDNEDFLTSFNAEFYETIAKQIVTSDDDTGEKSQMMALRLLYFHSIETFLTMVFAMLQAPTFLYGWFLNSTTSDLRKSAAYFSKNGKLPFQQIKLGKLGWEGLSSAVFSHTLWRENDYPTAELFAQLWKGVTHDFLDKRQQYEYNAIKHGLRLTQSEFAFSYGAEGSNGEPPEVMHTMINSPTASHFKTPYRLSKTKTKTHNFAIKDISIPWSMESCLSRINLLSMSIHNFRSMAQIVCGAKARSVQFHRPEEASYFNFSSKRQQTMPYVEFSDILDEATQKLPTREDTKNLLKSSF